MRTSDIGQEKLCGRCQEWWPADPEFFFRSTTKAGGLFHCCKACYAEWLHGRKAARAAAPLRAAA